VRLDIIKPIFYHIYPKVSKGKDSRKFIHRYFYSISSLSVRYPPTSMIPVHPKYVSGRYSNMYAFHQHEHVHNPHPRPEPLMWPFVRSSDISSHCFAFSSARGYHHPLNLAMTNRHSPLEATSLTTTFDAVPPSMRVLPLASPNQLETSPHRGSSAPAVGHPIPRSVAVPVGPSSGKLQQKEEYEAAEVLLGLTTREEKEQSTRNSTMKKWDGGSPASARKSLPYGHVTDESSTGTTSPTPPLICTEDPNTWFRGSISLSLPEDDDVLSPLHCFMRKYCVEAFSASAQDVATPRYGKSHGFKVRLCS
jgi:hypothetical protein